jgi:peptidoglycan hydrolase CwlO-like protein
MSDPLKKFIDENRDAFDSENPDPKRYRELQQRLKGNMIRHKADQKKLFRFIAVAASVVIISVSLYVVFQKKNDKTVQPFDTAVDTTTNPDAVYAKQIDEYQQVIDRQQAQLKQVQYEHPDLYRQFTDDINQLDSAYRSLKTTLEKNPNTEMLLEAMIRNLQIQSELLTRQLSIIKEIKQKSKA